MLAVEDVYVGDWAVVYGENDLAIAVGVVYKITRDRVFLRKGCPGYNPQGYPKERMRTFCGSEAFARKAFIVRERRLGGCRG